MRFSKLQAIGVLFLLATTLSARADTICHYTLLQDYSVIADGVEWRHMEYGWVCTGGGGGGGTGTGTGPGGGTYVPPTTPPPTISILSTDDANPSQLKITLNGSTNITATEVLLNGTVISTSVGYMYSGKTVNGPSLYSCPVNRASTVVVRGCIPDGRCATASFNINRYQKSSGTSDTLTATYVDQSGIFTVIKTARYSFSMGETFNETTYSGVYPISNATRVQFYKGNTTLGYWSVYNTPYPMYAARHWTQNLGPQSFPNSNRYYQSMLGCYRDSIGNGDTFVSQCAGASGFGGAPTAGVQITSMMLDVPYKGITTALTFNDSLSYQP